MIAVLTTLARASEADELLVASPVELTASDLGILLDADFRFVGGADRRVVDGDPPIRSVGGETRAAWTFERGSDQVKAEARAWGGPISAGIDGGFGHDSFLAIYRSVQVDNVLLIEPGATLRTTLPAEASWYVSALYVGRMLEVVCAGDEVDQKHQCELGQFAVDADPYAGVAGDAVVGWRRWEGERGGVHGSGAVTDDALIIDPCRQRREDDGANS